MIYAFVFGKNWKLSLAEILSYFEYREIKWSFVDLSKKAIVVDTEVSPQDVISDLGGTLKIVKIEKQFPFAELFNQDFGDWTERPISVYGSYKLLHNIRKVFDVVPKDKVLSHTEIITKGLKESALIFGLKTCYWGRTVAVSNPFEFKKRDIQKPAKRTRLAISPSRARILLNLSQAKENVLDPFCGVGTIAVEAIFHGIKRVYISDYDKEVLKGAEKNVRWAKKVAGSNAKVIIKHCDARKISECFSKVEAVATEPDLGVSLKRRPSKADARQIILYLKPLYKKFMNSLRDCLELGGRVAITLPCINSKSGKVYAGKFFLGYELIDPFESIPQRYREFLKLDGKTVLDEEREKGVKRNVIREFCVYRLRERGSD